MELTTHIVFNNSAVDVSQIPNKRFEKEEWIWEHHIMQRKKEILQKQY